MMFWGLPEPKVTLILELISCNPKPSTLGTNYFYLFLVYRPFSENVIICPNYGITMGLLLGFKQTFLNLAAHLNAVTISMDESTC